MICSNCGNEISDNAKFCDRCGSKTKISSKHNKLKSTQKVCNRCGSTISSDAVFCYKCGNNTSSVNFDETNGYITESNNLQTGDVSQAEENNQSEEQQKLNSLNLNEHTETTKKSNTAKIIVGSIIGLAILSTIAVINDTIEKKENANTNTNVEATIEVSEEEVQEVVEEPTPETNFNGIELTQVYTNEAEGMSFNYPEDWKHGSYLETEDDNIVYFKLSTEENEQKTMTVSKMLSVPGFSISALSDVVDSGFSENGIELQEKIFTKIDGVDAVKMITTVPSGSYTTVIYLYIANGYIYHINFFANDYEYNEFSPIFDAIMESYKITFPTERNYQEQSSDEYGLSEEEALEAAQKFADTHPLYDRTITGYIEYEPKSDTLSTKGLYHVETRAPDGSYRSMWIDRKTGNILFINNDGNAIEDGEKVYQEVFVANQDKDTIVFDGKKISSYIGTNLDYVYANFGKPTAGTKIDGSLDNGFAYMQYDNIRFIYNSNDFITDIIGDVKMFSYNGVSLDKTRDEIVNIFGEPDTEHSSYTNNYENYIHWVEYDMGDYTVRFEFNGKGGKALVIYMYGN